MSYIRTKMVPGRKGKKYGPYLEEVTGHRDGNTVVQKVIRYIGKGYGRAGSGSVVFRGGEHPFDRLAELRNLGADFAKAIDELDYYKVKELLVKLPLDKQVEYKELLSELSKLSDIGIRTKEDFNKAIKELYNAEMKLVKLWDYSKNLRIANNMLEQAHEISQQEKISVKEALKQVYESRKRDSEEGIRRTEYKIGVNVQEEVSRGAAAVLKQYKLALKGSDFVEAARDGLEVKREEGIAVVNKYRETRVKTYTYMQTVEKNELEMFNKISGSHWGSAESTNSTALGVAYAGGSKFRPIDKNMEVYTANIGFDEAVAAIGLRNYAQEEIKNLSKKEAPEMFRGQTLSKKDIKDIQAGKVSEIQLTGCTALSFSKTLAAHYATSEWTEKVGGKNKDGVVMTVKRDALSDNSLCMWHSGQLPRHKSKGGKVPYEVLSCGEKFVIDEVVVRDDGITEVFGKIR